MTGDHLPQHLEPHQKVIWALGKPLHAKSDDDICRVKGFNRGLNHPEDVVPDRHHGAYDEGVAFGVLVGLGILHG